MRLQFDALVIYWRGPSPFYFAVIPPDECEQIAAVAKAVTYGWGVIPVTARVGATTFTTSLFPKDGGYLLPIKQVVRVGEHVDVDDVLRVELSLDV